MRVVHALWRGFYLASAIVATRVLMGPVDVLAPLQLSRRMLAFAAAMAAGAFLSSVPGRLRKRWPHQPLRWQRCLLCFVCGGALALSLRMAGGGWWFTALTEGSAGAWGFGAAALAAGFITSRLSGRRRCS